MPPGCGSANRRSTTSSASSERLGYLTREPDPDDLRSKRVALTSRGTSAVRVIRQAVAELETTWAQHLGPRRFAQLRNLLLDLNQPTS